MPSLAETRICVQQIIPKDKELFSNIVCEKCSNPDIVQKLQAAFWIKKIWPPGSEIKIAFLGEPTNVRRTPIRLLSDPSYPGQPLDPIQYEVENLSIKDALKKICNERIVPITNLNIKFVEDPSEANVRIGFDITQGTWANVGTDCLDITDPNKATINFTWFDTPTAIHEFGHMLGMVHEHQNPKNKIEWNKEKIYEWGEATQGWDRKTTDTNIIEQYNVDIYNSSIYDPCSVMIYSLPAGLTLNNMSIPGNLRLSALDVEWINDMYPGGENPVIFYKNIYDIDFTKNKTYCIEKSKNQNSEKQVIHTNMTWIYVLIGMIVVFAILFAIIFILYHKNKTTRYFRPLR